MSVQEAQAYLVDDSKSSSGSLPSTAVATWIPLYNVGDMVIYEQDDSFP